MIRAWSRRCESVPRRCDDGGAICVAKPCGCSGFQAGQQHRLGPRGVPQPVARIGRGPVELVGLLGEHPHRVSLGCCGAVLVEVAGHPGEQGADLAGGRVDLTGLVDVSASFEQIEYPVAQAHGMKLGRHRDCAYATATVRTTVTSPAPAGNCWPPWCTGHSQLTRVFFGDVHAAPDVSPGRIRPRVFPARPGQAATVIAAFTGLLYLTEAVDTVLNGALQEEGIQPRRLDGLDGVLWAPVLHDDWQHLVTNTVPVLVLGFLVLAGGVSQFVMVTGTVWVVGGLGTWLVASGGNHIGASILVFGWLVYLLARGFFARSAGQILLAVVLFMVWGGVLWGVLPGTPGVSWEGHLFGALGGLVAARLVASADRPRHSR